MQTDLNELWKALVLSNPPKINMRLEEIGSDMVRNSRRNLSLEVSRIHTLSDGK